MPEIWAKLSSRDTFQPCSCRLALVVSVTSLFFMLFYIFMLASYFQPSSLVADLAAASGCIFNIEKEQYYKTFLRYRNIAIF